MQGERKNDIYHIPRQLVDVGCRAGIGNTVFGGLMCTCHSHIPVKSIFVFYAEVIGAASDVIGT